MKNILSHSARPVLIAAAAVLIAGMAVARAIPVLESAVSDAQNSLPAKTAPAQREWTVLVYLNGRNDLDFNVYNSLEALERAGSSGGVTVAAESARLIGPVQRLVFGAPGTKGKVMGENGKADMGSWEEVASFIKWGKETFPAKRYAFIFYSHGSGWMDPPKSKNGKAISEDDETGNYIPTLDLSKIFKAAGPVDIFAANACMMQMAEVAYELRDYAAVITGSEETMPASGLNYEDILKELHAAPQMNAQQAGTMIVDVTKKYFTLIAGAFANVPSGYTYSAVNGAALAEFAGKLKEWSQTVIAADEADAVRSAIRQTVRFDAYYGYDTEKKASTYADLARIIEIIGAGAKSESVKKLSGDMLGTYFRGRKLVINSMSFGNDGNYDFSGLGGLSVDFVPINSDARAFAPANDYLSLGFPKASGWDKFLQWSAGVWAKKAK